MLPEELDVLIEKIQSSQAEFQTIEVKSAHGGCPTQLYDTLSSFSNQDEGGIIVFGLEEKRAFEAVGVYDIQDLQVHVTEQCKQMEPPVRAVFTATSYHGKNVVSAEIPPVDIAERPCFYSGRGRVKGSYVRVGEADEPMTEYEVYSYEAFRKNYRDEVEPVLRADLGFLNKQQIRAYLAHVEQDKPNLAGLPKEKVLDIMGIVRDGRPTVAGVMLFSLYPQALFPQLVIVASAYQSEQDSGDFGKRIEGTLSEQLDGALSFVRANARTRTDVDSDTAKPTDTPDYPEDAVRELLLNALIHRDYSIYTQGVPIFLQILPDRLVIANPGGLYGRMNIDELGNVRSDTRNPAIATAMEALGETTNRYAGISIVRRTLREAGLPDPKFESSHGEFRVTLYREAARAIPPAKQPQLHDLSDAERKIVDFCETGPKSRQEIAALLDVQQSYAMRKYVNPLVERGVLTLTLPEAPRSSHQRFALAAE